MNTSMSRRAPRAPACPRAKPDHPPAQEKTAMKMRTGLVVAFVLVVAGLGCGAALAGAKDGQNRKVGSALVALHADYEAHAAQAGGVPFTPRNNLMRVVGDRVVIDAV